ncbi:MAG: hypothetical protein ACFE9X_17720, partial [Promethearchaeota archaeon]
LSPETQIKLKNALTLNFDGKMVRNLFNINHFIENKQYSTSLKMLKVFLSDYLKKCYIYFYHPDNEITKKQVVEFIKLISDIQGFPFNADDLLSLFERCEHIEVDKGNLEYLSHEIYNLMYDWYIRLKRFLNR